MRVATTDRTEIEHICLADAPFFFELVNSPTWLRFIGDRNIRDVKAAEDYLSKGLLKHYEEKGYSYYVVRINDATAIGICGFLKKPHLEYEDFGFAYLPEYQGQGYGFEAGLAILEYGIREFGFQTLDATTSLDNAASIGLLEKLGFIYQRLIDVPGYKDQSRLFRWTHP